MVLLCGGERRIVPSHKPSACMQMCCRGCTAVHGSHKLNSKHAGLCMHTIDTACHMSVPKLTCWVTGCCQGNGCQERLVAPLSCTGMATHGSDQASG